MFKFSSNNAMRRHFMLSGAAVIFASPCFVYAQSDDAPDQIVLSGIVRDFHERTAEGGHPDFERRPDLGFGHYAGNVAMELSEDGKPVFTGAGYKVNGQWRDRHGRNIAPHIYDGGRGGVVVPENPDPNWVEEICLDSRGREAYEISFIGVTYNQDGTSSWTYRVEELRGKDLSHWNIGLHPDMDVMPGTTAGYDFGVDGSTDYFGIKWDVNEGFSDDTFTVVLDRWYVGADTVDGILAKGGRNPDTGDLFVPTIEVYPMEQAEGGTDSAGTRGSDDEGGIESAESFDQWYRDVPGVNMSQRLDLTLVRQDDGSYVFDDRHDPRFEERGGFFPIDGELFGNSANSSHNYHFTFELQTQFTHSADANHVFQFTGDDDVWVFINGQLVIDLAGVHGAMDQVIELNRLGLEDGETYSLHFFFAERHRTESNFRITTTLELSSPSLPSVTAAFD